MSKDRCACGPFWMPKFLRRILSNKFEKSCLQHDIDYTRGDLSRWQADIIFFINLLKQSNNVGHVMIAFAYFIMVRIGGIFSYKKDNK